MDARGRKPWVANTDDDKIGDPQVKAKRGLWQPVPSDHQDIHRGGNYSPGRIPRRPKRRGARQSDRARFFLHRCRIFRHRAVPAGSKHGICRHAPRSLHHGLPDIFGTNILNVALLFGVDAIASGAPVLNRVGDFSTFGALLGVAVTGIFLVGIIGRRDRTIWRMGVDSAAVLVTYSGGLVLLFSMWHAV